MDIDFHIGFSYQEDLPKEIMDELIDNITIEGLTIQSESREVGVYMAMEWALPSIIVAYLSKPYFEAFLKEAGKDHYQLLKKGFINLFKRLFTKTNKAKRSSLFSVIGQLEDGRSVKFIFPEGLPEDEYEVLLNMLFELLANHYSAFPNDDITNIIDELQTPSRSVYLEYSSSVHSWVLLDPMKEARKARNAQKT
jgi:hypothetical protein